MPPMRGMRRITAPRTLLLIGVLATGCEDNDPNAGLPGAAAVDQFAVGITEAFCSWQFRCCSMPELEIVHGARFTNEATCVQSGVAVAVNDQLLFVRTAVGEGLMTFDSAKAADCLATYRNRPCNPPTSTTADPYGMPNTMSPTPGVHELIAACPGLLVGRIADGNRCDMTAECAAGSRCVSGSGAGGTSGGYDPYNPPPAPQQTATTPVGGTGICSRAQQTNEPCNVSSECDVTANLVCRTSDFRCAAPPGHLQQCNFNPVSGTIDSSLCDAKMGLVCDLNSLLCRKLPGEGEPCVSQGSATGGCDTSTPLVCVTFAFSGVGTCKRPGARGDACGAQAIAPCGAGLACRPTQPDGIGVCGDPPGVGEPCDSTGACASPYICSSYYGRCTMPGLRHLAESCVEHTDCASMQCETVAESIRICVPSRRTVVCSSGAVTPGTGMFIPPSPTDGGVGGSVDASTTPRDAGIAPRDGAAPI
jgi:hypothetical protein